MILRPYQQNIVRDVCLGLRKSKRQLIVLPTGSGKTVIFANVIKNLELKTLVLAHTNELIEQNKRIINSIAERAFVHVMTIQSAANNVQHIKNQGYQLIIIDECHRAPANSYQKIIDAFPSGKIVGVTATPFRQDGKKVTDIFGHPTCSMSLIDMIKEGFLCDFVGYRIYTNCSLKSVKKLKGDFQIKSLSPIVNVKNRNQLIVREYLKLASNEKSICFATDIAHAVELAKEFQANGIRSEAVHGKLTDRERAQRLQQFKDGTIQVITNCQILTEGFDEPSVTCLLMARPTCSKGLYTQMIGRGARLFPGKNHCKVIEYTDNEFDVCILEEFVNLPKRPSHLANGEKLSLYESRVRKELEEEGTETFVHQLDITRRPHGEIPASTWKKEFLRKNNISFTEPLTELVANYLIGQKYGKR